jgi:tetratricopeptide (TPR) repeat protein
VLDVESRSASPRQGFRTGTAVAVAAVAVVTGLGLTLLVGRALEGPGAKATPARSPMAAPSPKGATSPVELPAKAPEIAPAAAQKTSPARAPEASPKQSDVPVSSAAVPSCKEMLGAGFVEKTDPKAALAETQIANRELVRGNTDASHASFCKAALWDGTKVERWLNLAQMFLIRRDAEKAVETVERALELDPKSARALEILGDAWARLGDLQKARRAYLDAERRAEPDEDARKWLVRRDLDEAERSAKARDFVRAERLFRRVVVFDSEHAGAALGVAACLRKLGDQRGAEAWERRAETLARARRTGSQK